MLNEIEVKTLQLEKISQHQTRGAIKRSKARWHHEGEKNTKYFLSLEKRHFNTKTIKQLQLDDNNFVNTDDTILRVAKSYYEKLYSTCKPQIAPDCNDLFFPEVLTEAIDEQARELCEGLLTSAECFESLLENNGTK